jgi:hypothetical protein
LHKGRAAPALWLELAGSGDQPRIVVGNCAGRANFRASDGGYERQVDVLDFIFVALSVGFFVVSIGYVAACDRLMK